MALNPLRRRGGLRWFITKIIILVVLFVLPFTGLVNEYWLSVLTRVNIFLVLAITFDFFSGTTLYLNLGHSFIVGLAAYSLAIFNIFAHIPVALAIPLATITATIISLLLFLPSIRVKGEYFAILSLLYPIILISIATTQPFSAYLGGEAGLMSDQLLLGYALKLSPEHSLFFLTTSYYLLSLAMAVAAFIILYKLAYSDFGFTLRAIGEDEELAEATGVNTTRVKLKGFLIASALASLAGSFYAAIKPPITTDFVSPDSILIPILTAVIVGGLGSIVGTAISSYILFIIYEALWGVFGVWRTVVYMLILIVFVVLKPEGIMYQLYVKARKVLGGGG